MALSPLAKAAFFAIQSQLPSFGLGQLVQGTLPALLGCTGGELSGALDELTPDWLRHHGGIFRLRGLEDAMPWASPKYQAYYFRHMDELPPSPVVNEFLSDIGERIRRREELARRKHGPAHTAPIPYTDPRRVSDRRPKRGSADTPSIQIETEEESENCLLYEKGKKELKNANVYDSLVREVYGDDSLRLSDSILEALRKLESRGGDYEVLTRLGRLATRVPFADLTASELGLRWDELADDGAAPF